MGSFFNEKILGLIRIPRNMEQQRKEWNQSLKAPTSTTGAENEVSEERQKVLDRMAKMRAARGKNV
ncbi:hypothetical protein LCGC14_1094040 [marine sediment metagenome]|uniref:Uncharacterized protein n=1 Tax=marine sediment metagenome TaxID=412755 RepID=A0A0F9MBP2_9ZZZZ